RPRSAASATVSPLALGSANGGAGVPGFAAWVGAAHVRPASRKARRRRIGKPSDCLAQTTPLARLFRSGVELFEQRGDPARVVGAPDAFDQRCRGGHIGLQHTLLDAEE